MQVGISILFDGSWYYLERIGSELGQLFRIGYEGISLILLSSLSYRVSIGGLTRLTLYVIFQDWLGAWQQGQYTLQEDVRIQRCQR
jgi:hypothetical protein